MLGRLRMTLDECQRAYIDLSKTIFTPAHDRANPARAYHFLMANNRFQTEPLESSIKSTIGSRCLEEDTLLQDEDSDSCKVFVCATRGLDESLAVLRSYDSERHNPLYDVCRIWEAARATSAASTFFPPIEIGADGQMFVDGALTGSNNPIRTADVESKDIWEDADRLIISIGTGAAPGQSVLGNLADLAKRLAAIITNSERTNDEFMKANPAMISKGRLYRFNVMLGMASIGLEEHQALPTIAARTESYLERADVHLHVQKCVDSLEKGGQRMGYASTDGP